MHKIDNGNKLWYILNMATLGISLPFITCISATPLKYYTINNIINVHTAQMCTHFQ